MREGHRLEHVRAVAQLEQQVRPSPPTARGGSARRRSRESSTGFSLRSPKGSRRSMLAHQRRASSSRERELAVDPTSSARSTAAAARASPRARADRVAQRVDRGRARSRSRRPARGRRSAAMCSRAAGERLEHVEARRPSARCRGPASPSRPITSAGRREALDEARGDDADHALVPALAGEHEHRMLVAVGELALGRERARADELGLDPLALLVERVELARERARARRRVGREQELDRAAPRCRGARWR